MIVKNGDSNIKLVLELLQSISLEQVDRLN